MHPSCQPCGTKKSRFLTKTTPLSLNQFVYFLYYFKIFSTVLSSTYPCKRKESAEHVQANAEAEVERDDIRRVDACNNMCYHVGDHHQFKHPTKKGRVTITHPRKDIPLGTFKSILAQAGIVLP